MSYFTGVPFGEGEHVAAGVGGCGPGGGAYRVLYVCQCCGRVQCSSPTATLAATHSTRHSHDQGKGEGHPGGRVGVVNFTSLFFCRADRSQLCGAVGAELSITTSLQNTR